MKTWFIILFVFILIIVGPQKETAWPPHSDWTYSWLRTGGAVLGAAVGAFAASSQMVTGIGVRSAGGAAAGALMGSLLVQGIMFQKKKDESVLRLQL